MFSKLTRFLRNRLHRNLSLPRLFKKKYKANASSASYHSGFGEPSPLTTVNSETVECGSEEPRRPGTTSSLSSFNAADRLECSATQPEPVAWEATQSDSESQPRTRPEPRNSSLEAAITGTPDFLDAIDLDAGSQPIIPDFTPGSDSQKLSGSTAEAHVPPMNPAVLADSPSVSSTPVDEKKPGLSLPGNPAHAATMAEGRTSASSQPSRQASNVHHSPPKPHSPPRAPGTNGSGTHKSSFPPGFNSNNVHIHWNIPSSHMPGFNLNMSGYSEGPIWGNSHNVFVLCDPKDVRAYSAGGARPSERFIVCPREEGDDEEIEHVVSPECVDHFMQQRR